jgi:DNA primase large subunit
MKDQISFRFKGKPLAEEFIKVPFKDAISLVSNRQVFLHHGIAFVHIDDLKSIARS